MRKTTSPPLSLRQEDRCVRVCLCGRLDKGTRASQKDETCLPAMCFGFGGGHTVASHLDTLQGHGIRNGEANVKIDKGGT